MCKKPAWHLTSACTRFTTTGDSLKSLTYRSPGLYVRGSRLDPGFVNHVDLLNLSLLECFPAMRLNQGWGRESCGLQNQRWQKV